MSDGDHNLIFHIADEVDRPVVLRRNVHQFDQAAGLFLQLPEKLRITFPDIIRRLGAFFLNTDERAFHIDADQLRALCPGISPGRLHNAVEFFL